MPIPAPVPSRHARLPGALFKPLRAALGTLSAGAWAQASAPAAGTAPAPPSVQAAGSLRAAPTEAAQAFERQSGTKVALAFGASGPLKDRLVAGKHADVFVTYCTNATLAMRENPALQTCPLTQKLEGRPCTGWRRCSRPRRRPMPSAPSCAGPRGRR